MQKEISLSWLSVEGRVTWNTHTHTHCANCQTIWRWTRKWNRLWNGLMTSTTTTTTTTKQSPWAEYTKIGWNESLCGHISLSLSLLAHHTDTHMLYISLFFPYFHSLLPLSKNHTWIGIFFFLQIFREAIKMFMCTDFQKHVQLRSIA